MTPNCAFELESVTLRRDGTTVLDDVDLQVPAGCCTGLVGPSGAGKSTLLRLCTRLEEASAGLISFHGVLLADYAVLELRRRVQLVTQQPVLLTDSVVEEIRLASPGLGRGAVQRLLTRVGLPSSFAERTTKGLSGGEAQRVVLARAVALRPEVLLLDEPTSALDADSAAAIEETVLEHVTDGGTVVLVSHNIAQVRRIARQVGLMEDGRVVAVGETDLLHYPEAAS
jgi:putative ABC transport system ATP-binding protein